MPILRLPGGRSLQSMIVRPLAPRDHRNEQIRIRANRTGFQGRDASAMATLLAAVPARCAIRRRTHGTCGASAMSRFIERHPAWALVAILAVAFLLYLVFAIWPPGLEEVLGRKRVFLNALLNGITLGGLYFLVASGFTLIFGLMRNVNLAHGSLYLLGGYIGYEFANLTGAWLLSLVVAFVVIAALGIVLQFTIFRWMEGQDLRQTLVTIAISIVLADLMLWRWGGDFYQVRCPSWLTGPVQLPLVTAVRSRAARRSTCNTRWCGSSSSPARSSSAC